MGPISPIIVVLALCVAGCYGPERSREHVPKTQAIECARQATIEAEAGNLDEALRLFDDAIAADPKYTLPYKSKAAVLGTLQRYEDAVETLMQAIKHDPHDADAYLAQGIFLELADRKAEARVCYATALDKYEAMPERPETDLDRRLARVQVLYLLRGRTEALKAINEVLDKYPENELARTHKYRILADQRDAYLSRGLPIQSGAGASPGEGPSVPSESRD